MTVPICALLHILAPDLCSPDSFPLILPLVLDMQVHAHVVMAASKLLSRLPPTAAPALQSILQQSTIDHDSDVQQRSCEFSAILLLKGAVPVRPRSHMCMILTAPRGLLGASEHVACTVPVACAIPPVATQGLEPHQCSHAAELARWPPACGSALKEEL